MRSTILHVDFLYRPLDQFMRNVIHCMQAESIFLTLASCTIVHVVLCPTYIPRVMHDITRVAPLDVMLTGDGDSTTASGSLILLSSLPTTFALYTHGLEKHQVVYNRYPSSIYVAHHKQGV